MEYKNLTQIMITDDGVLVDVKERTDHLKTFTKNFNYKLWDKQSIISLMEEDNNIDYIDAFNKIKPYSFKADLARFYIINKFGGWYTDINNRQLLDFPNTENIDMIVFRERLVHTHTSWAVATNFFYSTPNNIVLSHALDTMIYNIKNNFYGKHALYPTGPTMFGRSIAYASYYSDINIQYGDFVENKPNKFLYNGKFIAESKLFTEGNVNHPGTNHYPSMWHNKDIYN